MGGGEGLLEAIAMLNIPAIRNASAFCAAAAIVSVLSLAGASAASLSLSGVSASSEILPSNFNPTVTNAAVATQLFNDHIVDAGGVGIANITIYDPSYPGGLFATGPGIVTYQFVGEEAGFDNQTWRINTPNELLFQNSTATSGDTKGGYSVLAGALPFLFRSNSVVGDDAINGGPIGPNLQIGIAIVSDTVAYAFFDDGGGSPIDADFDDVILRITAVFRGGETTPTPLPGALPLLASGLGAFGYFGWRRKRKIAKAGIA